MVKVSDMYTNSNWKHVLMIKVSNVCKQYFRGDINIIMQTIGYWVQSPNTSSRAGTSLSLEVVMTSLKSETSIRSIVSGYDAEV